MKKSWPLAILSSLGASMCCIGPVLLALTGFTVLGTVGIFLSRWRVPLFGLAIITLIYSWFQYWRSRLVACRCYGNNPLPWGLLFITVTTIGLLAYPTLADLASSKTVKNSNTLVGEQTITLKVEGMTCVACARGIDKTLLKLTGVTQAKTDFNKSQTEVKLDTAQTNISLVIIAIDELGYHSKLQDSLKIGDR